MKWVKVTTWQLGGSSKGFRDWWHTRPVACGGGGGHVGACSVVLVKGGFDRCVIRGGVVN